MLYSFSTRISILFIATILSFPSIAWAPPKEDKDKSKAPTVAPHSSSVPKANGSSANGNATDLGQRPASKAPGAPSPRSGIFSPLSPSGEKADINGLGTPQGVSGTSGASAYASSGAMHSHENDGKISSEVLYRVEDQLGRKVSKIDCLIGTQCSDSSCICEQGSNFIDSSHGQVHLVTKATFPRDGNICWFSFGFNLPLEDKLNLCPTKVRRYSFNGTLLSVSDNAAEHVPPYYIVTLRSGKPTSKNGEDVKEEFSMDIRPFQQTTSAGTSPSPASSPAAPNSFSGASLAKTLD